jgi:hypothetical protein
VVASRPYFRRLRYEFDNIIYPLVLLAGSRAWLALPTGHA